MEKATEDKIIYIAKQIEKLPDRAKDVVSFMIDNFDLIEKMCKVLPVNQNEIKKRIALARKNKDYTSMIILCAAKAPQKND